MLRYSILVKGRVQGVGFRYFVQLLSAQYNLTGWVKNLDNGDVQLEVQNLSCNIDIFIEKLKKGNRFSKVDVVDYEEIPEILNEKKFKILY